MHNDISSVKYLNGNGSGIEQTESQRRVTISFEKVQVSHALTAH